MPELSFPFLSYDSKLKHAHMGKGFLETQRLMSKLCTSQENKTKKNPKDPFNLLPVVGKDAVYP